VDEVFVGTTTILREEAVHRSDIDPSVLVPNSDVQSLLTQDIRLREATLEQEYHQDTYRFTTTDSPQQILAYYHAILPTMGWTFVCAPRSVDGPRPRSLDSTCSVGGASFSANWRAHALFKRSESPTHLNIIIHPQDKQDRAVEIVKIRIYKITAIDDFTP
jgi:hypothetical protein